MSGFRFYVRESYSNSYNNYSNIYRNQARNKTNKLVYIKPNLEIKTRVTNKSNSLVSPCKSKYSYRKPLKCDDKSSCNNISAVLPKLNSKTIRRSTTNIIKPELLLSRLVLRIDSPPKIRTKYTIKRRTSKKSPISQSVLISSDKCSRYKYRRLSIKGRSSLKSIIQKPTKYVGNPYKLRIKKAIETLRYRRKPICMHYVRNGICKNAESCRFIHDINHLRICPKFLLHVCPLGEANCPLAHVLDPCRVPQCVFFEKNQCSRESCPYLHIKYENNTPICQQFLHGRCELGRKCVKQHKWLTKKTPQSNQFKQLKKKKAEKKKLVAAITSDAPKIPSGSLRDIFPAPNFIPFELDTP